MDLEPRLGGAFLRQARPAGTNAIWVVRIDEFSADQPMFSQPTVFVIGAGASIGFGIAF
jgi:hypothetical protein